MTKTAVKSLGEIAFRVEKLEEMQAFYENDIGLELMKRFDHAAFFKIADGHAGHTAILALFDRTADPNNQPISQAHTTVDHIAFTIDLSDFDSEVARLESLGHSVRTTTHAWVQWRSLYLHDPEGNLVELVCFDQEIVD